MCKNNSWKIRTRTSGVGGGFEKSGAPGHWTRGEGDLKIRDFGGRPL